MMEIVFLLGFFIHNIEEAIWLPDWSKHATKYHKVVSPNEFRFAVTIFSAIGILFLFQYLIFFPAFIISKYIFLGFVLMMVLNAVFPHLVSTILLKKYAPGTLTGFLLNVPIGLYILITSISDRKEILPVIISFIVITVLSLLIINVLFKIGRKVFD